MPTRGMNRRLGLLCFICGPLSIHRFRKKAGAAIFAAERARARSGTFAGITADQLRSYGAFHGFERSCDSREHRNDEKYYDRMFLSGG